MTKTLDRVPLLADVIRDGGDKAQQLRRLAPETVDALIDAGMFRFALPSELGGEGASSMETVDILAAISAIDASVGWNVMLGSEINAMAAGGMDRDVARSVFLDDPRVVMCGGSGPGSVPGPAIRQADGGYRVTGRGTFASGCHNSTWSFLMAAAHEAPGVPMTTSSGVPIFRMFFLNRSEWDIEVVWDMAGLRGSGSDTVVAVDGHVRPEHADVQLWSLPAQYDNPVYRMPVPFRLAYNKAGVALGVAQGALQAFEELSGTKTPMMSSGLLRDRPDAQSRYGRATAIVRSARAYLVDALNDVEEELHAGREVPSAELTQAARLACVHATNTCMEAVDLIHNAAGTSALRMDSPLERKLRDAHGCATHRWVAHPLYGDLGRILLGGEPGPEFDGSAAVSSRR
jgi:indole-3-acetate monooxygenase